MGEEKYSRADYAAAQDVIRALRKYGKYLTRDEIKTIRGQALNGDRDGAAAGLKLLLKRRGVVA